MRILRTVVVLAVSVAVAVAYTWPLATALSTSVLHVSPKPDILSTADVSYCTWALRWDCHQLRSDPVHLFDANIMYPLSDTLAYSEHLLGIALLIFPLDLLHGDAIANYNVAILAALAIGMTGVALLVQELGGSLAAGLVAGALATFIPGRLAFLAAVQQLSTEWMPFALLFLHRIFVTGRWSAGLGFATFFCLTALTSAYYFYYFGVLVALYVVFHVLARRPAARRAYRVLVAAAVGAVLVLLPTFVPYARARDVFVLGRRPSEAVYFSALGENFLGALLDPRSFITHRYVEGHVFVPCLGYGTIFLLGAALAFAARRRGAHRAAVGLYLAVGVSVAAVSLGPVMRMSFFGRGIPGPYAVLGWVLPGFAALRTPARMQQCAFVALAVAAGLGADTLLRGSSSRLLRAFGGILVLAVLVADCWRPSLYVIPAAGAAPVPEVYRWLATAPDGPMVELPLGVPDRDALYMVYSTYHWKRMVNGYSGFSPAGTSLRVALFGFPDPRSLRLLHRLGVRYVLVHPRKLMPPRPAMCQDPTQQAAPYLALRHRDGADCVFELLDAPAEAPTPPERRIDTSRARATSSTDGNPQALLDDAHPVRWTQPVDSATSGWLQIDLPDPHVVSRVVLRLGRHFGDYPRALEIATSVDGVGWQTVVKAPVTDAPLVSFHDHPDDVRMEIAIPPTEARHVRLVRPAAPQNAPFDQYANWLQWGAEGLELCERAPEPTVP